jgi:hypothetical protein
MWIRIQLKIFMRIRIRIQILGGGGGRSAKNVHPPWQNPRYAPGGATPSLRHQGAALRETGIGGVAQCPCVSEVMSLLLSDIREKRYEKQVYELLPMRE